jgi:hypothetical protein
MPNFVTFDDGLNYISISDIESFGDEGEGDSKGTWIKFRNGEIRHSLRKVSDVASKLGPTVNLYY